MLPLNLIAKRTNNPNLPSVCLSQNSSFFRETRSLYTSLSLEKFFKKERKERKKSEIRVTHKSRSRKKGSKRGEKKLKRLREEAPCRRKPLTQKRWSSDSVGLESSRSLGDVQLGRARATMSLQSEVSWRHNVVTTRRCL